MIRIKIVKEIKVLIRRRFEYIKKRMNIVDGKDEFYLVKLRKINLNEKNWEVRVIKLD